MEDRADLTVRLPDGAQILIVCADDWIVEQLETVFRQSRFISQTVKSITAGCAFAKSGRFQVVVFAALASDGSWRRLVDIARHYNWGFEVILLARTFDLIQWTEALKGGRLTCWTPCMSCQRLRRY